MVMLRTWVENGVGGLPRRCFWMLPQSMANDAMRCSGCCRMLKRTQVEGNRATHSENPVGFLLRTAPGVAPFAWLAPKSFPRTRRNLPVVFIPSQLRCIPSRNGTAAASLTVTVTALHQLKIFLASLWLRLSLHAMVRCACTCPHITNAAQKEFSCPLSSARHPKPRSIASLHLNLNRLLLTVCI